MFSTGEKTKRQIATTQQKGGGAFFRKAGEEGFFQKEHNPSFFASVQPKLTISNPNDPQEKEADEVASQVMRSPESHGIEFSGPAAKNTVLRSVKNTKTPYSGLICRSDDKELLSAKGWPSVQRKIRDISHVSENSSDNWKPNNRNGVSLHRSDVIQLSGRGPPEASTSFERTVASTKGAGSTLPEATKDFMETRFRADFSGVKIHSDSNAQKLNQDINAQAFAHGNDIYFNSGKYAPDTSEGNLLIAHELTHTLQQGTSKSYAEQGSLSSSSVNRNVTIHRSPENYVHLSGEEKTESTDNSPLTMAVNAKGQLHSVFTKTAEPTHEIVPANDETNHDEIHNEGVWATTAIHTKRQISYQRSAQDSLQSFSGASSDNILQNGNVRNLAIQNTAGIGSSICSSSIRGPPGHQGPMHIQRSVVDDALSFIGSVTDCISLDLGEAKRCGLNKAQQVALHIPGYRALRVVLGQDPITNNHIDRNGRNFIEAAFDIMPGGILLHQKLDELHLLDDAAAWIDTKIANVITLVNGLFSEFSQFWNGLGVSDFASPMEVLRRGANIILRFISHVIDFAEKAGVELLKMVKDYLLNSIVDFIKEHTTSYPLLRVILGHDPITGELVPKNGMNILNALLELGGEEGILQRTQMHQTGSFQKVVNYIDQGIAIFSGAYDQIVNGFHTIWDRISIRSLIHPIATFQMIFNEFSEPVSKVWNFVSEVGTAILGFIKEVLMTRLSTWAKAQRGYLLVTVIIGKDPFTNQVVPRSVENIIHGFMKLMDGGEEQFNQMKESGAIARAAMQIDAAVARLHMTQAYVVQLFTDLWNSFSLDDLVHPILAFRRIISRFGEPIGRLIAFVVEIVKIVIHVILQIMNFPFALINNIITKALQAFELIKADPIGFLKNLLKAIKQGFMQFFGNILTHLWNGLKQWFLSEVKAAGIPIPTDFSVMGIIKWLLVLLDITMEKIWKKLEDRIGKEKVIKIKRLINQAQQIVGAAGEANKFIQDVRERGFMTVIVEKIKEKLTNVWDMVIGAVKTFVIDQIVNKVTQKILSMLDPTGIMAVINSAIALYRAIQSFIKYLRQMLEIVNSFVEGTLQIAQGATKPAADFLEGALANGVPIVIGFLANQIGLNLSERLMDALIIVRNWVDQGLTWLVDKLVTIVERLVEMGRSAANTVLGWLGLKKEFLTEDGESHSIFFQGTESKAELIAASDKIPFTLLLNDKRNEIGALPNGMAKTTKEQAWTQASTIFGQINSTKASLASVSTSAQEGPLQTQLNEYFNEIIPHLRKIGVGKTSPSDLPLTVITPQPVGSKAGKVIADPLTKKLDPNYTPSRPQAQPAGWATHIKTIPNYSDFYVRLHILSQKLGGPGIYEWNLTPGRKSENTNMEQGAETPAFELIQQNRVLWYEAEVTGYRTNAPFTDFAEGINIKYGFKEKNETGQWARIGSIQYSNTFEVTQPGLPGENENVPNINTMSFNYWDDVLKLIPGRPSRDDYRSLIIERNQNGSYATWNNFIDSDSFKNVKAKNGGLENWFMQVITDGKLRNI
ncbi:MAG: hypothetical protein NVSMB67_30210 [Flavisolibacter sp.]